MDRPCRSPCHCAKTSSGRLTSKASLCDAPIGPPKALASTVWTPTVCQHASTGGARRPAAGRTSSAEKGSFFRRGLSWLNHLRDHAPDSTDRTAVRDAHTSCVQSAALAHTLHTAGGNQREPNGRDSGKCGFKPRTKHGFAAPRIRQQALTALLDARRPACSHLGTTARPSVMGLA